MHYDKWGLQSPLWNLDFKNLGTTTVSLKQKVSVAFGKALEADLPGVFLRSDANPRALLTLVLGSFLKHLLCGPKVAGFQEPCDLSFPRRLRRVSRLADLLC